MRYLDLLDDVSKELDLPKEIVKKTYIQYWKFIRNSISSLPLKEDLTEDEFSKLRVNFNIPSIGKLYCTYDNIRNISNSYKRYLNSISKDENQED